MIVEINTRADRSLFLMMPMMPVKKADIPQIPAISIGTASKGLLKNVSPPRCPEATRSWNNVNSAIKATMSHIDHLPNWVLGTKYSFTGWYYISFLYLSISYGFKGGYHTLRDLTSPWSAVLTRPLPFCLWCFSACYWLALFFLSPTGQTLIHVPIQ